MKNNIQILLLPGHGKSTAGKRSPDKSFFEWKFNRSLAKRLYEKLSSLGYVVNYVVGPDDETDYSLTTRYRKVNSLITKHPDLHSMLIEIHANAAGNGSNWMNARGYEIWTTVGQNNSDKLAECILKYASEVLPAYDLPVRSDKTDGDLDKEKNFTVIYNANCPAVLIENLFYDNKKDLEILKSEWGLEMLSDIIVAGINNFTDMQYI